MRKPTSVETLDKLGRVRVCFQGPSDAGREPSGSLGFATEVASGSRPRAAATKNRREIAGLEWSGRRLAGRKRANTFRRTPPVRAKPRNADAFRPAFEGPNKKRAGSTTI